MNLDAMRKFCATLPGATVDIKWGADECHCVGGRMFAVFGPKEKGRAACRSSAIPSASSS